MFDVKKFVEKTVEEVNDKPYREAVLEEGVVFRLPLLTMDMITPCMHPSFFETMLRVAVMHGFFDGKKVEKGGRSPDLALADLRTILQVIESALRAGTKSK